MGGITLAQGYQLICRNCGKKVEIIYGWYYGAGWGDLRVRDEIMAGKYGQGAIDALNEHPEALYHIEGCPYQCKGHFIGNKDTLCIYSNDLSKPELYFRSQPKCPRCRKTMKPWKKAKPICPKCKGVMELDEDVLWIE